MAGENETARLGSEILGVLEQRRIVVLDQFECGAQLRPKRSCIGKAGKPCKAFESPLILGQGLGLLVRHHLDAMLDGAQELIGLGKLGSRLGRNPLRIRKGIEHVERAIAAQFRIAATGDELLRLHEEFDLADAAAAELDIVAEHRDLAMPLDRVDLALQRLDVGDGGKIEIFAPDIGNETREEFFAERPVAGDGARLDHRGALPVLAHILVIDRRRFDRNGDLGGARIRTQPQIDAKDISIFSHVLEEDNEPLGETDEEGRRIDALGKPRCLRVVEDDQIDIARIIELIGAELAHAEDGVTRILAGIALIERSKLAAAQRLAQKPVERRPEGGLGETAEAPRHLIE